MPLTRLCPQCSASVNVKKAECTCGHAFCKRRSIGTKERKIAMMRKRQLEPEGTMSMRRERDRLSKARHRGLESESEVLRRKVQNKASMAKKRALEPESEALLRKEHDRASKAKKRALEPESEALRRKEQNKASGPTPDFNPRVPLQNPGLGTCYCGCNFINAGEVCTSVLFHLNCSQHHR